MAWYQPDWSQVLREEGEQSMPIESLPRFVATDPPSTSDLVGDGPLQLSVEQTVMLALRQNRDLAVEQLSPVIVGAFEQVERGQFDPELFAGGDFIQEEALETSRSTGEEFNVRGSDVGLIGGVRQTLPTGTDVAVSVSQRRDASNRSPEQQSARVGLTVTQSLLRGFGTAVNLAAVRQAELETLASVYELRGFTEALLSDAEIAYWRYVLAQQEIAIFDRSLTIARQQLEQIDQRIEVGVLAPTEAAAARSEVALREQALIEARSTLTARRLELLRLINPTATDSLLLEVVTTSSPTIQPVPIDDVADRIEVARRYRPDLNEAELRLEQNRLETVVTRNGLLPRLDLFIALGKTGFATTFPESFRELNGPTYDVTTGVSLSLSLGNRTAEGRYQASLASRQQAALAIVNLQQIIELDVRLAVNEAERARKQIAASTLTRQLQEETVNAEIERFDVGASTTLLVAQAQRDLLQAQIREVEAVINYRIALVQLYLAEGSVLERRHPGG